MSKLDSRKLKNINKPARYVGGEVNEVIKSSNVKSSVVLCYPNLYEKAMSSYMVNLLYNNINDIDGIWCKRCFAPDIDFENILKSNNCELYSLEDFKSIRESDILLFVIDNELDFTNFFNMLNLAGINIYKNSRNENLPKVLLFPVNNVNIKPISGYADYVFNNSSEKENVKELLKYLIDYIGSDVDVNIKQIENGIVPSIKINNSSIIIDFDYINDIDNIISYIEKSIKERGINKVSFRNYDKIDSYKFCEAVYKIKTNVEGIRIVSKNIDFNKFEPEILDVILPCLEQSTIYFNVVTCSEKLRSKIKVGTDKEKLTQKINKVFKNNRNSIRLDFNIGLPEETYEDIDDIYYLLDEIINMYSKNKAKDKFSMKVNLKYYIPNLSDKEKYNMNSVNKLETKLRYIKEKEYDSVMKIDIEDISSYTTKILLKNGDESISSIIHDAYNLGARFDSDNKKYDRNIWEKVAFDNLEIINMYTC